MSKETVLITGAGRGLGKEIAYVFAENDFNVMLTGRTERDLERVAEEICEMGVNAFYVPGDINSHKTLNELEREAKKSGVSVLVNNAGSPVMQKSLENITDKEIEETFKTNLISPIKLTKRIYGIFLEQNYGTIININSLIGLECKPLKSVGCASRWGLRGFTGSLNIETDSKNIRVIGVYPTQIKTRPEYQYGYEPREVAEEIYRFYSQGNSGILKLDGRPEKFKPKENIEYG